MRRSSSARGLRAVYIAIAALATILTTTAAYVASIPPPAREVEIVTRESGLDADRAAGLVRLAGKLRGLKGQDLEEGVSTRLVVYAATLIAAGMPVNRAIDAAMIEPLSDDPDVKRGLRDLVVAVFG